MAVPALQQAGATVFTACSQSFPASARLKTQAEFARVLAQGRRTSLPLLTLHWLQHTDLLQPRLGVAVSRKVDRRAVGRNRIKRRLRDEFRKLRMRLPAGDYVFIARAAAATATPSQLREAVHNLFARSGALPLIAMTGTMPALSSSHD